MKKAVRNSKMKARYGIDEKTFEEMKSAQKQLCAICLNPFKDSKNTHIDHCHITGKVRGILCADCNSGLGRFKDNEEALDRAIEYLRASRKEVETCSEKVKPFEVPAPASSTR